MLKILKDKSFKEKEKKLFLYIVIILSLISVALVSNIFFLRDTDISHLEFTLGFVRLFNSILSILAFGSCLISYYRLKNDSIFIISLMYLGLAMGIILGQIDYLSFYYVEFTLSNYIIVSTSMLRISILIITILPNNKLRNLIIHNKIASILFVVVYSILFGSLEKSLNTISIYDSSKFFIMYNLFLMIVYIICSIKLLLTGIKEKEYLFVVLSASIFILAIKAAYAIYGANIVSFNVKLTSVSITYIFSLIVIAGGFIELYMYIQRTRVLNDRLSTFYDLTDRNMHSFMFLCDENGDILYANKKLKENYFETDDVDIHELNSILKNKINSLDNKDNIIKLVNENGGWRGIVKNEEENKTIDCSVQLINTVEGYKAIAATYMDISDEISLELELEKFKVYDKEKSEFISNISHELRTPLNIFYSTVQLLDRMSENETLDFKLMYKKYKKPLHVNCKRMLRLINNVMDISNIDTGILKPNFGNYDIVSISEDITLSVVNYASLKSINIQFDTNVEEHIIKCDPTMIERILLNLLSNAIKFSEKNKNIYVDLNVEDKWVQIEVKDEGIGINDNVKHIIFDKFVQVDKSFTRMNEGSGIGLSIVKSMIDLHNGNISVESEVNVGSTFKILLPNECLNDSYFETYDINNSSTELELSDIYEVVN
ncbi:MAG: HAMP domain-containing sensor histidine kinase [Peptostreptococcaceae bacterium]|nr:HAMP domain-containing sensor histidine kinase [Peptostreptococcaceae bacterium]